VPPQRLLVFQPELEASIKYLRHEPALVMRSVKKKKVPALRMNALLPNLMKNSNFSVTGSYTYSVVNNSLLRKPNAYFLVK